MHSNLFHCCSHTLIGSLCVFIFENFWIFKLCPDIINRAHTPYTYCANGATIKNKWLCQFMLITKLMSINGVSILCFILQFKSVIRGYGYSYNKLFSIEICSLVTDLFSVKFGHSQTLQTRVFHSSLDSRVTGIKILEYQFIARMNN